MSNVDFWELSNLSGLEMQAADERAVASTLREICGESPVLESFDVKASVRLGERTVTAYGANRVDALTNLLGEVAALRRSAR